MDNHSKKCNHSTSETSQKNESHQDEAIPLPEFGENTAAPVVPHDPHVTLSRSYLGMVVVPNHGETIQEACQGQPLPEQATAPYVGMVPNHSRTPQSAYQGQEPMLFNPRVPPQARSPYVGGMVPNHGGTHSRYLGQLPPMSYVPVVLPQARSPYLGMVPCNHGEPSQAPFQAESQMYHAPTIDYMARAQDPRMQQPLPRMEQPLPLRNWSTGLFSCFDEISSCALGTFCPCILAMTISCSVDECCCTGNCYPVALRASIRKEYNIVGSICEDAYVMCWCCQCGLCQIAREIDEVARELETSSQLHEQNS